MFSNTNNEGAANTEDDDASKVTRDSDTSTQEEQPASEANDDEVDPETVLNFTKVSNLAEERKVISLYKKLLVHVLKE